jgi:hypothetical protein
MYTQNKILIKFNSRLSRLVEMNKGVCQGSSLLPTVFGIYVDDIRTKWQKEDKRGIPLSSISSCGCCYLLTTKLYLTERVN